MWVENKSGGGGDCPKSQTFLSENRESDSGLVWGYGVFQSRKDFSDGLGEQNQKSSVKTNEADPKGQPHSIYVLRAK